MLSVNAFEIFIDSTFSKTQSAENIAYYGLFNKSNPTSKVSKNPLALKIYIIDNVYRWNIKVFT